MRFEEAVNRLCNWGHMEENAFDEAMKAVLDELGGIRWICVHQWILFDPDDVFHARGFKVEAGWEPPLVRTCIYRGTVLYLTRERLLTILSRYMISV